MMQPGKFNSFITIQARSAGEDELGQPVDSWATISQGECWAQIVYLSGIESIKADANVGIARVSIRVFYRSDINPGMRVIHEGKTFEIKSVLPDEVWKKHVDLGCEVI